MAPFSGYEVLGNLMVFCQQLLGVFRLAVATVAKASVVVVVTDSWVQTYALDDLVSVQAMASCVGIQLAKVGHTWGCLALWRLA